MSGLVGIRAARGTINHENKRGRREKREREETFWKDGGSWMEGKRKKTIIGLEVFLRAYIRIFDIDDKTQDFLSLFVPFSNQCGSNFNNSRHANPRYASQGNAPGEFAFGTWLRVDIFYLPFPLPFHRFLLAGWSMDFPPGILHHLVRIASILARLSERRAY